jgi:hypothetical protein
MNLYQNGSDWPCCQNRLRQGAASESEVRLVRFGIQTWTSPPTISDERCTRHQRLSRPLTQAVLTSGAARGLCEKLSGLCVEPISNTKDAQVAEVWAK